MMSKLKKLLCLVLGFLPACKSAAQLATEPVTDALPHALSPMKKVKVGGHEVAFYEGGKGKETLLFVHGLGSNASFWKENLNAFEKEYRVIAVDLPGFGASSKANVTAQMGDFALTLVQFLDVLKLSKVTYIGLSMGGQIGITMALHHPNRIERLVLVSPAGIETFTDSEKTLLRNFMTVKSVMEANEQAVTASVALNFDTWNAEKFGWLVTQRMAWKGRADFQGYALANEKAVSGMLDGPVFNRLGQLKPPTLVLYGRGDKMIPNRYLHPKLTTVSIAASAQEAIPHAIVELLDGGGHLLQLEQPERFNQRVLTWLKTGQ